MATYKVIQDIEAEDKLLGPLTLRQFIYAALAFIFGYLSFLVITKGAPIMAIVFIPFTGMFGFFAWPWKRDQPTEVWALARIRFFLKPRVRIWNQTGVRDLVTITAPKKIEQVFSNGLSETEVKSRLRALADTIDSRGWAVKNVNVNMYGQSNPLGQEDSERLISLSSLPQAVSDLDIQASDDMLEASSPVSRQFDTMIAASTKAHREDILNQLRGDGQSATPQQAPPQPSNAAQPQNFWFMNQQSGEPTVNTNAVTFNTQVVSPVATNNGQSPIPTPGEETMDERALVEQLKQQEARNNSVNPTSHWHTIQPISAHGAGAPQSAPQQYQAVPQGGQAWPAPAPTPYQAVQQNTPQYGAQIPYAPQPQQVTPTPNPAILQLAGRNDLDVATLARQANINKGDLQNEVVISLH